MTLPTASTADPAKAAEATVERDPDYAASLARELERRLSAHPLERAMRVWDISKETTAQMFGVSRPALSKWLANGAPAERRDDIALLDEATRLLLGHLKVERVPAVVRRPYVAADGASLLDLAVGGQLRRVRDDIDTMFDVRRVQP